MKKAESVRLRWGDFPRISKEFLSLVPAYDNYVAVLTGGVIIGLLLVKMHPKSNLCIIRAKHYKGRKKLAEVICGQVMGCIRKGTTLIVDDVADTGDTLRAVKKLLPEADTLTLHRKPWSKVTPTYYWKFTDKWLVYPWEEYEKL